MSHHPNLRDTYAEITPENYGSVVFVDPNGNDSVEISDRLGRRDHPFKTVSEAVLYLSSITHAGGMVYVMPGLYEMQSEISVASAISPLTIKIAPNTEIYFNGNAFDVNTARISIIGEDKITSKIYSGTFIRMYGTVIKINVVGITIYADNAFIFGNSGLSQGFTSSQLKINDCYVYANNKGISIAGNSASVSIQYNNILIANSYFNTDEEAIYLLGSTSNGGSWLIENTNFSNATYANEFIQTVRAVTMQWSNNIFYSLVAVRAWTATTTAQLILRNKNATNMEELYSGPITVSGENDYVANQVINNIGHFY